MILRALHDNIVIQMDEVTKSSSILVGISDISTTGQIVSVGPNVKELKEGQRVHFGDRKPVSINGKVSNFVVISENDIFAVLE